MTQPVAFYWVAVLWIVVFCELAAVLLFHM
jgi:hypothetical protein